MSKVDLPFIQNIEALIQKGLVKKAAGQLSHIHSKKLNRKFLGDVARLARRAGIPQLSLRVLNPVIRPDKRLSQNPTPVEKIEYAASLIAIGAPNEALRLLHDRSLQSEPEALLFRSFGLITQWNYAEAIPLLEKYTSRQDLSDYSKLIGQANLLSALVVERKHDQADKLSGELINRCKVQKAHRLIGNVYEVSAQNAILKKDWFQAELLLDQATDYLSHSGDLYFLFVKKWRAILDLFRDPGKKSHLRVLNEIKEEAKTRRHWETIRSCDAFEAVALQDKKRLFYFLFGTPYESLKMHVRSDFGKVSIPNSFLWTMGQKSKPNRIIDLKDLKSSRPGPRMKGGQTMHRLLATLCTDFYRPFRLPYLFSTLYPSEYYNPFSSSQRVYRVIYRLKAYLDKEKIPVDLVVENGVLLKSRGPCAIRVYQKDNVEDAFSVNMRTLKSKINSGSFTAKDVARALSVSHRSSLYLLKQAVDTGKIAKLARGKYTAYKFNE